jgi:class 3 adenylate cyclase
VLATVLFIEIVRSTERAAALGDQEWKEIIVIHNDQIRKNLARYGGREIKTTGDGFLATFDAPGRAIRAPRRSVSLRARFGLEIRAGLHTGEIELMENDVAGIAVHIGARIAALVGSSEVLVSDTVKDLVVGSGIEFVALHSGGGHYLDEARNWEKYSFGTWLKGAAKRLHRNKAATALANKLARITWSVLRNDNTFDITHSEVGAV